MREEPLYLEEEPRQEPDRGRGVWALGEVLAELLGHSISPVIPISRWYWARRLPGRRRSCGSAALCGRRDRVRWQRACAGGRRPPAGWMC